MVEKRNWFLRKVWQTVRAYDMFTRGERVVVAVSGGGDSVAMLLALKKLAPALGLELVVAHLNHQLRASAREDQTFVCQLARDLGLPVDTRELPRELLSGSNVEARARVLRYAYLREVAQRFDCTKVATGHTRDDQAETILLRLLRGTGLRGLRGILPVRSDGIVRPLIDCSRAEARDFLLELGVPWREDESNRDLRLLRNRVRAALIPELKAMQPGFSAAVARLATVAREAVDALDAVVNEKLRSVEMAEGHLDLASLRELPPYWRGELLRLWLRQQTGTVPEPALVRKLNTAVESRTQPFVVLSGRKATGYVCTRGEYLIYVPQDQVSRIAEDQDWSAVTLEPGRSYSMPGGWLFTVEMCVEPQRELDEMTRDEMSALVDADALKGSLVARPARHGDTLTPLGMRGKRKLQDVYCDRHVARLERWGRPIVEDAGTIVWVPGVVRAEHARIRPTTRRAWHLRATRLGVERSG